MKKFFIFALLVGLSRAEPGWNEGTMYTYSINSQSLSTFNDSGNEYHGVIMKASLQLQKGILEPASLIGKLKDVKYTEIHSASPNECSLPHVEHSLNWETFNTSNATFELVLDNGVVRKLLLRSNMSIGEANIIRAAVSQLQIDLQGKNAIESKTVSKDYIIDKSNMQFSTMEESITGHCETIYDISRLSKYAFKNKPSLAPLLNASDHNNILDIVKITNFSNCKRHSIYHRGINGRKNWDAGSSLIGDAISRQAEAKIIVNGSFENYTMHSSVIIEKMFVSPSLYRNKKAMIMSCMNLTLKDVRNAETLYSLFNQTQTTLQYDYEYNSANNIDLGRSATNDGIETLHPENKQRIVRQILDKITLQNSQKHRRERDVVTPSPLDTNDTIEVTNTAIPLHITDHYDNSTLPLDSIDDIDTITFSIIDKSTTIPDDEASSFETSTATTFSGTTAATNLDITSDATDPLPTNFEVIDSTLANNFNITKENVSINSTRDTKDKSYVNITSVLHVLNMSKSLEQPLLSSFFSIYTSLQNKSTLHSNEIHDAIKIISEQIASQLLDFKTIIDKNVLNAFCELTFLIANTEFEVLHNVSHTLYASQHSSENKQHLSWVVFRDAVTQAGTGPALMLIKEWILYNKTTTNEAAEIIEQLPSTAEIPNEYYIDSLFEMVKHPLIHVQESLNVSALLAFTNLVRQVFVNSYAQKALYPVHIFSPMVYNQTKLKAVYLQYLQEHLENAVIKEDCCKIHVYIKAMGNLAHPEILNIFNQYLRNNTKLTTFQKVLIVISLDKIAELYPAETQNFLFTIYIDENEHYEVRTAAVFQIMLTKPPANILKRIAEFTQFDSSNQVIAAVKSSIKSAAELTDSEDAEFRNNAKSAVHLLNPKKLGIHYSTNIFKSNFLTQLGNLGHKTNINYIGSENNIAPKGLFINYEPYLGGLNLNKQQYGILFSDMKKVSYIVENFWSIPKMDPEINLDNQFSTTEKNDIQLENEYLNQQNSFVNNTDSNDTKEENNIDENQYKPETMLLFQLANAEKFVTFGKNFSSSIEKWLQQKLKNLKTGYKFNYNKLYQKEKFLYALPNVAGLITQVIYKVPSMYHLTGKVKLNVRQGKISTSETIKPILQELNFTGQFNLGYSLNKHTDIGFVTPFNGNRYITGYKEQFLLYIPIILNTTSLSKGQWTQITTSFSPSANDSLGFYSQFNSQLYTRHDAVSDIVKKQKVANTKIIQKQPASKIIKEVGGLQLNISVAQENDLSSFLDLWSNQKSIDNKNIILRASFPSSASSVAFRMQYANLNDYVSEEDANAHETSTRKHRTRRSSVKSTNNTRQFPILINNTFIAEWSVLFNKNKNPAYMVKLNYTLNEFTNKTKFMASLYQKPNNHDCKQCNVEPMLTLMFDGVWAHMPLFNFSKVIAVNPKSEVKVVLLLGSPKIPTASMECNLQRTSVRKKYILEQQETKKCLEEMQDGNLILPSCQLASQRASYFDQHKCTVQINRIVEKNKIYADALQNIQTLMYKNFVYYPREHPGPSNRIFFLTQFGPSFEHVNISILFPKIEIKFKNINIYSPLRPIVEIHPSQSALTRIGQELLESQYNPTCVLDKDKVNTFDNRTYTIKVGTCWYVLMALTLEKSANEKLKENDILILARDTNEGRAIRVLFGDDVVDVASPLSNKSTSNKYIYVNNMQYRLYSDRFTNVVLPSQNSNSLLQGNIVDQKIKLNFVNISTHVIFDGIRIILITVNTYRRQTLGLCGTFSGEESDDFMLPKHCNIHDSQLFSSSYAIVNNDTCSGQALEWANIAINKSCSFTNDIYFTSDFPRVVPCPNHYNREPDPRCITSYVQVQQDHRNTCFSKNALPKCKSSCYPINVIRKTVTFHCVATSVVSTHFVDAIRSGKIHDFSTKKTSKSITMDIPSGCYKC